MIFTEKAQIIDKYFGNFLASFAFVGEEVAVKFTATAENFLQKYNGSFTAKKTVSHKSVHIVKAIQS